MRIVKKKGVIQLEISQRTLLPFGLTDAREENTWKGAEYQFSVKDHGAIENTDYFTLSYENRSINLDDLTVPQGKLVTGVRFFHLNGHIVLQVRATDFNYPKGQLLNLDHNPWVVNNNGGRNRIILDNAGNPLAESYPAETPRNPKDGYIRFEPSDFDEDLSQATVPFIETLPVEPKHPVALSGVGLYHKGKKSPTGSVTVGIVAVKLISYDFPVADLTPDEKFDYIE